MGAQPHHSRISDGFMQIDSYIEFISFCLTKMFVMPPVALTFIQNGLVNFTKSHLIADLLVVLLLVPITGKWFFVSHVDMFRKEKPNFHLFR